MQPHSLRTYFTEIFGLFYPERCAACGEPLPEGARFLCPRCQWDMPLTGYATEHANPVASKFWGLAPIDEACSLLFFSQQSRYRTLIHGFKYHGRWNSSLEMGRQLGATLRDSPLYATIDRIIPVPLHPRRRLTRGYNQSEYIARGVADRLTGASLECGCLKRSTYNRSQTHAQSREERWQNVNGIFTLLHPERLDGHHILLIDDVLTTGSTLIACTEAILRVLPTCHISIATLAVSAHELFGDRGQGGL